MQLAIISVVTLSMKHEYWFSAMLGPRSEVQVRYVRRSMLWPGDAETELLKAKASEATARMHLHADVVLNTEKRWN
jgi:hypothetical protein